MAVAGRAQYRATARAGRAPRRRDTRAPVTPVSGRRYNAAKGDGETFTPEEREAANQAFDEDIERERSMYRREGARQAKGRAAARQRRSSSHRRALSERPVPGVGLSVNDGASFILGLLAWVLTMQYIRGGQAQVKAWLRAKFLNQTSGGRPK